MIEFSKVHGLLATDIQNIVTAGFARHSALHDSPPYQKDRINWLVHSSDTLIGVLTSDLLWDWLYIDELWVDESARGQGLGRKLIETAEEYARSKGVIGTWLWTQSWQAADFYRHLGYQEFARFDDFPKGYSRIGFRKKLSSLSV